MKRLSLLSLLCFALFSCKDKDEPNTICGVNNPATDLAWLKAQVDDIQKSDLHKYFYISKADYNGTVVFTIDNCCPMCNTYRPVYHCDGTEIMNPDYTLLKNSVVAWQPDDFVCLVV